MDRDHRAGHRQLTGTHRTATIIPPSTLGQQARIATFHKQRDSAALWAELEAGWCNSHHARWRQRSRPPTTRARAAQLRLEIQYALQCRVDAKRTNTTPRSIKPLLNHLAASGAGSLLERPLAEWLAGLPAAAALHNRPRCWCLIAAGLVAWIQLRLSRQRCPPVLAHSVEKPGHAADLGAAGLRVRDLDGQPC